MKDLRIGISMRVTNATGYFETRDSIAIDWSKYMQSVFSESKWMLIPNLGRDAVNYFEEWDLNALILTGGDDIGAFPERDKTEIALLKMAIARNTPVIGICRGMQLIHHHFNGKIEKGNPDFISTHRATRHKIELDNQIKEVNSYHSLKIEENTLNKRFKVLARCVIDNSIESFIDKKLLGIMWHPEREEVFSDWNKNMIKTFLTNDKN